MTKVSERLQKRKTDTQQKSDSNCRDDDGVGSDSGSTDISMESGIERFSETKVKKQRTHPK